MSILLPWIKNTSAAPVIELALDDEQVAALVENGHLYLARHISYELSLIEKGAPAKIKELGDAIDAVRVEYSDQHYDGLGGLFRFAFDDTFGKFRPEEKAKQKYWDYMGPINDKRKELNPHMTMDMKFTDNPVELLEALRTEGDTLLAISAHQAANNQPRAQL